MMVHQPDALALAVGLVSAMVEFTYVCNLPVCLLNALEKHLA